MLTKTHCFLAEFATVSRDGEAVINEDDEDERGAAGHGGDRAAAAQVLQRRSLPEGVRSRKDNASA